MSGSRRQLVAIVAFASLLVACGAPRLPAVDEFNTDLGAFGDAVAAATGYSKDVVELTGSRVRLRVAVGDHKLSASDQSTREQVASAAVAAIEPLLKTRPAFAGVQAISVAIIHPNTVPSDSADGWHVEDVLEFRKGSDQRFSLHAT